VGRARDGLQAGAAAGDELAEDDEREGAGLEDDEGPDEDEDPEDDGASFDVPDVLAPDFSGVEPEPPSERRSDEPPDRLSVR